MIFSIILSSLLEVDPEAEGEGAGTGPDGVVDAVFGDDFGVHSAVASEDKDILHSEGEADVCLPFSYGAEGIT